MMQHISGIRLMRLNYKFYPMNTEEFIKHFCDQFDDINPADISAETKFKELEGWDSLVAISLIAMVDAEYGVKLTGDEIRNAQTVSDLFVTIKSKS